VVKLIEALGSVACFGLLLIQILIIDGVTPVTLGLEVAQIAIINTANVFDALYIVKPMCF
jgi:ABC-type anion transport system duplicated permease subunit